MSILYSMVEQGCYILNSLPFEGARSLLMGGFKEPKDKVKVPGFVVKSNLDIKKIKFEGFGIHRFRRKSNNKSENAVLFLPGGGGMERATSLHYDVAMKIAKGSSGLTKTS